MDNVEVSTLVYVPPETVYEFLVDFEGYASYSTHLAGVDRNGSGGPGTKYDIHLTWWKLSYTVTSKVTAMDAPERVEWELVGKLDAHGAWIVEPAPEKAPEGSDAASRVRLHIEFDADSADSGMLDLPRFVSLDWVIEKVTPKVLEEAELVVERIVKDLEGEHRPVELTVHEEPDTI